MGRRRRDKEGTRKEQKGAQERQRGNTEGAERDREGAQKERGKPLPGKQESSGIWLSYCFSNVFLFYADEPNTSAKLESDMPDEPKISGLLFRFLVFLLYLCNAEILIWP